METQVKELSLVEKIQLAEQSGNASLVARLKATAAENDLLAMMHNNDSLEIKLNEWAKEEAKKLDVEEYPFHLFFHLSDKNEWRVKDGTIVHIHYYGAFEHLTRKDWWAGLRSVLRKVPSLYRSTAIEVQSVMLKRNLELTLPWKKVTVLNEEKTFNLLSERQIVTDMEITITKRHPKTGLSVTVSGNESDRVALENMAWVTLSRRVYEFNTSKRNS